MAVTFNDSIVRLARWFNEADRDEERRKRETCVGIIKFLDTVVEISGAISPGVGRCPGTSSATWWTPST
jgi:hypothetical protein